MKFQLLITLVLLFFFTACSRTTKITEAEYDPVRQLYEIKIENVWEKAYLRNLNGQLIRTEAEKNEFISDFNAYFASDEKEQTNELYNQYYLTVIESELYSNRDLNKNKAYTDDYFEGVRFIKTEKYEQALSNFDHLAQTYPDSQKFTDLYFLKGYAYEKMSNSSLAVSNYQLFIDHSVQKYSALFHETDKNQDKLYRKQLNYANEALSNSQKQLSDEVLKNDTAKYYNNIGSPGFNRNEKYIGFGLSYNRGGGLGIFGFFELPVLPMLNLQLSSGFGGGSFFSTLVAPIQVYKSFDRRWGFTISSVVDYMYHYSTSLTNLSDVPYYEINNHVFNFGMTASAGFYITPSLFIGLSGKYMLFNQDNKQRIPTKINNQDYTISYYNLNYYELLVRYYFIRDLGVEVSLMNNEIQLGVVSGFMRIGYNFSHNSSYFDFYNLSW